MEEVVNQQAVTQPAASEGLPTQAVVTPTQPGEKTDPALLLKSLQEERQKRKELEQALEQATLTNKVLPDDEVMSDEGRALKSEISSLTAKIAQIEEEKELDKLYAQYPLLKEKANEFNEYRKAEHPRAKIGSVAKLYLAEQGLLEVPRKGLEKQTGGDRTPVSSEIKPEDLKNLRVNNPKKYQEMLTKGLI